MTLTGKEIPKGLKTGNTLVVNTNSPLVTALYKHQDVPLAEEVAHHLYDLALLAQKELPSEDLASFVKRSASIMDKLLK
jgi:molecular chaperone HtpG